MKKFKFTMQSLLNIKLAFEKQQKAELAEIEARLRDLIQGLDDILKRHDLLREEFAGRRSELTSVDFQMYAMGFTALREREKTQRSRIKACEKERDEAQRKLVETMTERKTLEKLKEKQFDIYLEEVKKEEDLAINEFLTNKVAVGGDSDG